MSEFLAIANGVAGIDEAGRGPLAGPVVAASVVLDNENPIAGLVDSKTISAQKRIALYDEIIHKAYTWGVGYATAVEIDEINIHQATLLAMQRAYLAMNHTAEQVYIDGLHCPDIDAPCTAIVKGDQRLAVISAASILAKVTRDWEMEAQHKKQPQYGFNQHKGYPTTQHLAALQEYGPCDLHRKSYRPVKEWLVLYSRGS